MRLSCLEAPTPLDRDDISGRSTRFSTTYTTLRAVKEAEECDESHVDFTRQCGKSPVTTSAVLHCIYLALKHPTTLDRDDISGQSTRFFTTNTALRAVKEAEECDESHVDFTRLCDKSPVTTSAVFHCVFLAWKYPRHRMKVTFQFNRPAFPPQIRPCVWSKRLRSAMNRTLTSPDSVASPQSQRAQFSIAFILPGSTTLVRRIN